jgi:bacillithiol system protein YtxJ
MHNIIRSAVVLSTILLLIGGYTAGTSATAKDAPGTETKPDMVIDDDVVSEWHNEKMTELTRLPDFARSANTAKEEPVLIFKHSTTCPISGRAAQRIDKLFRESKEPLPTFYMVKVIESRPVSQLIAEHYEVKHESPQILLLKDGEAVWNTSHDEITAEAVLTALEEHDAMPEEEE